MMVMMMMTMNVGQQAIKLSIDLGFINVRS